MTITVWKGANPPKRHKYGAQRVDCEVGGRAHSHPSAKERARHWELAELERQGAIRELASQVRYRLSVHGWLICDYVADYRYRRADGTLVVEDVKSPVTAQLPAYRIKKRLMLALYGIEVRET